MKVSNWKPPPDPTLYMKGHYTLVEHPEDGTRRLEVRGVTPEQQERVRGVLGYLFATEAEAAEFAQRETYFKGKGPLRQTFSHKRIDGLRIYVHLSRAGG